ncbi:MAG: single-stranded DNA-binding protein [Corynebacterium sp.]|nr:single-stranded DNA-binding protein [Corynebacterium sp.]
MAGETPITLIGNVVADPELRYIASGSAVVNFRVASTPRSFNRQTNQWEDGEALFLTCNAWREYAENIAHTLKKGMRVIVSGRLKQRSFQTQQGENRTVFEVEVDEVGPSLRYATAEVTRISRDNQNPGGYNQNQGGYNQNQGGFNQGGFRQSAQPQNQEPQQDPWNSAGPADGMGGQSEPPF